MGELHNKLIEESIRAACLEANADPQILGPILREQAIVVEHDGRPFVGVRLEPGTDVPELSLKCPASEMVPMGLDERIEELRLSGKHADAFEQTDEKDSEERRFEGRTVDEVMAMSPGEVIAMGRRLNPPKPASKAARQQAAASRRRKLTAEDLFKLQPGELLKKARGE